MSTLRTLVLATAFAGLFGTSPVMAASFGVATGVVEPDADGFDSATTANFRLGQEIFDVGAAEFDIELEVAKEVDSGDAPGGQEYDFTSVGVGLSARTAGPVYAIGSYGIARNEIDVSGGGSTSETQQSVGVGVGGSVGILQIEVMARRYLEEGDLDDITWISAGIRF